MSNKTAFALELQEPGDHSIDSDIICVMTRFGLRHPFYLLPTWRDYRLVVRQAARTQTPGLLRAAFLIENPTTCYSLSFWTGLDAIAQFGTNVTKHVKVGNRIFGRLSYTRERGPEIWSAKLRLDAVSNNLNWQEFDLRALIFKSHLSPKDV